MMLSSEELIKLFPIKTQGKYLAVFSALHPTRSRIIRAVNSALADVQGVVYQGGANCGGADPHDLHKCQLYTSYFPIVVFQVILIVVIMLIIVCVGIICTCSVQTPARFETPKKQRNENQMM